MYKIFSYTFSNASIPNFPTNNRLFTHFAFNDLLNQLNIRPLHINDSLLPLQEPLELFGKNVTSEVEIGGAVEGGGDGFGEFGGVGGGKDDLDGIWGAEMILMSASVRLKEGEPREDILSLRDDLRSGETDCCVRICNIGGRGTVI